MLATTLIYLSGLGLCLAAGVALAALLEPGGRWLTPAAPAMGAAFLVVLAHLLGFVLAGATTAVLLCVVVAVLLALAVWRRRRAHVPFRAAIALSAGEALTLVLGGLAGLLLLAPVLDIGFPTTLAAGIADGWARAVLSEWLLDHALHESADAALLARPIGRYSTFPHDLGAGYEYLIALVSTVTGRPTYQTALPVAALAGPIAVAGWAWLQELITAGRTRVWQALVLVTAALTPMFVVPLTENYLTQFFSIALWPFAMAALYAFLRTPGAGTAAVAAIGLGAVAAVYPPLVPWLAPPALLLMLVGARRRVPAFALLALALVIVTPVILVRAYEAIAVVGGLTVANPAFPLYGAEQDLAIVLGGSSQFLAAPTGAEPWGLPPVLALLLGAAAVGGAAIWTMAGEERRVVATLGAGVGAVTLAVYLKYKYGDDYGYGTYKALLSGGALLAGLLVLALASPSARWRSARLAAAGICLAIWVPVTANALQLQRQGAQGFRESENGLIAHLGALPATDVVLVEGAAENAFAFPMRMTAGYVAAASPRRIDGLGSTPSYITGGGATAGAAGWLPTRPWRYVVTSDAPSAFPVHRRTLWHQPPYRIQDAPELDVTPFGRAWGTPPPGSPPSDLLSGPAELIVSNRGAQPATATLDLGLKALTRPRELMISAAGAAPRRVRLPVGRERRVRYSLPVAAHEVARVTMNPGAPEAAPLVTLTSIDVG